MDRHPDGCRGHFSFSVEAVGSSTYQIIYHHDSTTKNWGIMKKTAFIIAALVVALFLAFMPIFHFHHTDHTDPRAQAVWLWSQVQKLQNRSAPPSTVITNKSELRLWAKDGYLVFSNGWAAFACHTFHDSEEIGDIALLRTTDGIFYVSHYHFCCGETIFDCGDQPKDFSQFLEAFGAKQNWTREVVINGIK